MAVATKEHYPTWTKDTMEQITSYSEWGITYEGQGNRKVWMKKERFCSNLNKFSSIKTIAEVLVFKHVPHLV